MKREIIQKKSRNFKKRGRWRHTHPVTKILPICLLLLPCAIFYD